MHIDEAAVDEQIGEFFRVLLQRLDPLGEPSLGVVVATRLLGQRTQLTGQQCVRARVDARLRHGRHAHLLAFDR